MAKDDPMRDANERRAFADAQATIKSMKALLVELLKQGAIAEKCDVEVWEHDADAVVLEFEDGTRFRLDITSDN
jgi:hypothetical protein